MSETFDSLLERVESHFERPLHGSVSKTSYGWLSSCPYCYHVGVNPRWETAMLGYASHLAEEHIPEQAAPLEAA